MTDLTTGAPSRQAARRVGQGLGYLLRTVIIDPVRDGRLRDTGWPVGMRGVAVVSFGLATLLIMLAGLSSVIRSHLELIFLPPQQSLPRLAVPVIIASLFFATGTLYAALLHVRLAARIPGLLLVVFIMVQAATIYLQPASVPALVGCLAMIIFAVLRRHRSFSWIEYLIAQLLTAATLSATLISLRAGVGSYAPRLVLTVVIQLASTLLILAAPFGVAAGAAIAELLGTLALAVGDVVGRLGERSTTRATPAAAPLAIGILGVLAAGRAVQLIVLYRSDPTNYTPIGLISGLVTIGLPILGLALVVRRPGVQLGLGRLDGTTLLDSWREWALLAGALIAGTALWPTLVTSVARALQWDAAANLVDRVPTSTEVAVGNGVAAVALLAAAFLLFRGDRRVRLILILLGCFRAVRLAAQLTGLAATYTGVLITADLIVMIMAADWLVRRQLTTSRLAGIASVILISGLYEYRHVITEPITEVLALSGVLVGLLVGAIWRLLTDNELANGESPGFPVSARVLLVLANIVFGTAIIALVALQGGVSDVDLESLEQLGDAQLGGDLMFSLLVVIIVGMFAD